MPENPCWMDESGITAAALLHPKLLLKSRYIHKPGPLFTSASCLVSLIVMILTVYSPSVFVNIF